MPAEDTQLSGDQGDAGSAIIVHHGLHIRTGTLSGQMALKRVFDLICQYGEEARTADGTGLGTGATAIEADSELRPAGHQESKPSP